MNGVTLQIKPVGNECNLSCKYCYASPFKTNKKQIIEIEIIKELLEQSFTISDNLTISWHGGEPLLAGKEFFRGYIELIKREYASKTIVNMIQTNATLLDEEYASILIDGGFIVSVSIDGPPDLHNENRLYADGRGSLDKVLQGVRFLRGRGFNPAVIVTVTGESIHYPEEVFEFLVENGFEDIKYSPVYNSADDIFSINPTEWGDYLIRVFDYWMKKRNSRIKVRDIDEILTIFTHKKLNTCSGGHSCLRWISVDPTGALYPCEYLRSDFSYGTIGNNGLINIRENKNYDNFKKNLSYVDDKCKICELQMICNNGCPATREKNGKLVYEGRYVFCESKKKLYQHIKNKLFPKNDNVNS